MEAIEYSFGPESGLGALWLNFELILCMHIGVGEIKA